MQNHPLKVLLVEDEAILSLTEKKSLEQYGYSVTCASRGQKPQKSFWKKKTFPSSFYPPIQRKKS